MRKLFVQDHQLVERGALLIHHAEDQSGEEPVAVEYDCVLLEVDSNQTHGLVQYSSDPFKDQEQWVPGDLLSVAPSVEPAAPPWEPGQGKPHWVGKPPEEGESEAQKDEEPAPAEEQPATNPS